MDIKAMREQQCRAVPDIALDGIVKRCLRCIRCQDCDDRCTLHCCQRLFHNETICFRLAEAAAACTRTNDHVMPTVFQVQGMCPTLAAIAQYCDLPAFEARSINIFF